MLPRVLISKIPEALSSQNLLLAILHRSTVAVGLTVRITTSTGVYTQLLTTVADRTTQTLTLPVAELPTSITIFAATTTVLHGQILIEMQLRIAGTIIAVLATQYLSASLPVYWPPGERYLAVKLPGELVTNTIANPAAGVSLVYTVPANSRIKLLSINATLTTVGVNTPLVNLTIETIVDILFVLSAPLVHPAAAARTYYFIANSPRNDTAFDSLGGLVLSIPPIDLPADAIITLAGQDGDDDWGRAIVYTENLIEAAL